MSLTIDQQRNVETTQDIQDFLLEPSTTYPSDVKNNIPNGSSNGQIPLWYSGGYTLTGNTSIRVGQNAGFTNFKDHSIALGTNAGRHENGTASIAIGFNAGRTHSGTNSISIGYVAGNITQGMSAIAIGDGAGKNQQADWCVALGIASGSTGQLNNSIAIGASAGNLNQGTNSVAIGVYAGYTLQGQNCVAIGNQAGMTSQPTGSIVLNASGNPLSGVSQSSFYCDPVRNVITSSNLMSYNTSSKEVGYATNINLSNPLIVPVGSATDCSVQFSGSKGCGIFSSSTDTLDISTGGSSRFNVNNTRTYVSSGQLILLTGSASLPSFSFNGNSTTGFFSGGASSNTIKLSTNGVERLSVDTLAHTYSLPIKLQTTGGTASNLDYYEELTHSSSWTYTGATIPSFNFLCRRIGKMVSIQLTTMGVAYKNTGGASKLTLTTALPTRFRPSESIYMPISIEVNANTSHRTITINSTGVIEIGDVNTSAFAINTDLRVLACSYTFTLS